MDARGAPAAATRPRRRPGYDERMSVELRVAVFEDDARYRQGLETLLRHAPGMRCAGVFPRLAPGLAAARADPTAWDLVLMDLEHPDGNGIDAIRALKALRRDLPVLALTVFEEPATVVAAICAGADGYLVKRSSAAELLAAMRNAGAGGATLSPGVAGALLDVVRRAAPPLRPATPTRLDLTEREQDVLRTLSGGRSYAEAAQELGVGLETVRTHVRSLYRKLQVHSVGEAVARAIREGLV